MRKSEFGGFILRIVLGVIFIVHGLAKLQEGITAVADRFASYNLPFPEVFAYGVTGLEIIGGIFIVIGFSIRLFAFLFILLMAGAIATVKFAVGFLQGYELDLALMAMATYLLFASNRFLALDNFIVEGKEKRNKVR
ncbi:MULTISPECIES: DoxX family protein [Ureibacillus]|uniref:Putative membrane protein YphA (DoxX/SURF4 family) n=1 Tax=Ureibacillus thermosphaericus TaxID=51173 RepID=A0A840PLS2_URETH|nr:DoxX family protein [Ureibacillus thermosphaericus]MBB5149365.1 putative membrane protein YphA (DoxX/SURF4 family) [Ureibacillus thermosphaericus]NKZ32226.1 DoxX family protein [Ureibacillus thermosphaericus]